MLSIRTLILALIFAVNPLLFSSDYSYDRLELVASQGEAMDHFRISAFLDRKEPMFRTKSGEFFGSLAANYAEWKGVSDAGDVIDISDIGLTPMISFFPAKVWWRSIRLFIEAGIGAHLLSDTELATKNFSTQFQFGDHLGLGILFSRRNDYRLSYNFQHFSNGGIKDPNPGINFHQVSVGFRWR